MHGESAKPHTRAATVSSRANGKEGWLLWERDRHLRALAKLGGKRQFLLLVYLKTQW